MVGQAFAKLGFAFRFLEALDVGIDAHAELREDNHATGRLLGLQIKAGQSYLSECKDGCHVFRTDSNHVKYWLQHALPVLICLSDVDTRQVYWQMVSQETAISTGKGFKIKVPKSQKVDTDSQAALQDILTPIIPTQAYTLVKSKEWSYEGSKRYAFHVALTSPATKAEIASIVRHR